MKKRKNPDSDFRFEIRKIFRSDPVDDKRNTMELMVVVWMRSGLPVLEKRRVWRTMKGEIRLRKLVGMNLADVEFVAKHYDEIVKALQ